jgi:hypothetical protein
MWDIPPDFTLSTVETVMTQTQEHFTYCKILNNVIKEDKKAALQ